MKTGSRWESFGSILVLAAAGVVVSACSSSSNDNPKSDAGASASETGSSASGGSREAGAGDAGSPGSDAGSTTDAGNATDAESTAADAGGDAGSTGADSGEEDAASTDSGGADAGSADSGAHDAANTGDSGDGSSEDSGAAVTTLLVDNDYSDNNNTLAVGGEPPEGVTVPASPSDTLFPVLLGGTTPATSFDTFVVPDSDSSENATPGIDDLTPYARIVWYCGSSTVGGAGEGCVSPYQEQLLETWLDMGHKELVLFYENIVGDLGGDWNDTDGDTLLYGTSPTYAGLIGGEQNPYTDDSVTTDYSSVSSFIASGVTGTRFANLTFKVTGSGQDQAPLIASAVSDFNVPTPGATAALVTVPAAELDSNGDEIDGNYPVVIGTSTAGGAGTSKLVIVGMPIENVNSLASSQQAFMNAVLAY